MKNYKKVLVALDLNDEAVLLIDRAKQLLAADGEMHLIHVTNLLADMYPVSAMGSSVPAEVERFQQKYFAEMDERLQSLASIAGVAADNAHLRSGIASQQIKQLAEEKGANLIVVGLHEKKRLASMLGQVANGVLHSAPCDVLTVNI